MSGIDRILVTGAAGFIGFHLSARLLADGRQVVGLDNLNDYYDVQLKRDRLALLEEMPGFSFLKAGLEERATMLRLFAAEKFDAVVNLAAQAGVRYSLTHPYTYIDSNINGFINILEACRSSDIRHLVYASSSSVYGANTAMPFSVHHNADHPLSLYAATKKANELMAHAYSSLYGIPTTGLRFFTVYGPWGRPDMAYFSFTRAILEGKPIDLYNQGRMQRDFTCVDDIVEGLLRTIDTIPQPDSGWDATAPDPGSSSAPFKIYNIGNNRPVELTYFIEVLERCIGRQAVKNFLPMQAGDLPATCADVDDLFRATGFRPSTSIEEGIGKFVEWYRGYYR